MAVDFITQDPNSLLKKFKDRINQSESKGKITTWELDADGDVTHKSSQWGRQAWMCPRVKQGKLTFSILAPTETHISYEVYAFYHGHLTETFLAHFDTDFNTAQSTALPTPEDRVVSP